MNANDALRRDVRAQLLADADRLPAGDRGALRARASFVLARTAPLLSGESAEHLLEEIVRDVDGFGALEPILADPDVTEVMLNRPGRAYVERCGRLVALDIHLTAEQIIRVAERVIAPLGLRLDRSSPMVDARLPDGSRLHAVLPPLAPDGPCVTIRRFVSRRLTLADFGADDDAASLLSEVVRSGCNLLIAGGTSAGKTSLLNTVAGCIDDRERIVTIEETAELALEQPHVVRLEARPANAEGVGAVTVRELVRASLRMRPDRIIVGEVRGPEAVDMLQALNTGHDGSMCTVHANGPTQALVRVETLALMAGVGLPVSAVRAQIAAAIDYVIFVTRDRDGTRRIEAVAEVIDPEGVALDRTPLEVALISERVGGRLELCRSAARRRRTAPTAPGRAA
jgi:pilus assembly protein CpaF